MQRSRVYWKQHIAACAIVMTASCQDADPPTAVIPPLDGIVEARLFLSGLTAPVHLAAPTGDARVFIVEQRGVVRVAVAGTLVATPFLDISARVSSGGERGLLSIAFDPLFATNRRFYVNFTDLDGTTRIERYVANASNPNVADEGSMELIIAISRPNVIHNGGHLLFGPDGMLYIPMGDGGGSALAQNPTSLLGKLLRIDVRGAAPYAVPSSNPYVGVAGALPEIWALGLRNPWRVSFDAPTAMLYVADVGENQFEEINVRSAALGGLNYGWNTMEGSVCFNAPTCTVNGLSLPAFEYAHDDGRCSITGGAVYRGLAMPSLRGHYFYADFCEDGVRTAMFTAGAVAAQKHWDIGSIGRLVSFGTDGAGELYVMSTTGTIHKLQFRP